MRIQILSVFVGVRAVFILILIKLLIYIIQSLSKTLEYILIIKVNIRKRHFWSCIFYWKKGNRESPWHNMPGTPTSTISEKASLKIIAHACKFPHQPLFGLLLGSTDHGISNAIPLFHTLVFPTLLMAIEQVWLCFFCIFYKIRTICNTYFIDQNIWTGNRWNYPGNLSLSFKSPFFSNQWCR